MWEFLEKSWVPAEEAEDGDGEAEELLPVGEGLGGEEAGGGALDCVLEEAGGFEVSLGFDDVVDASVFDPFEADFGYAPPLVVAVEEEE